MTRLETLIKDISDPSVAEALKLLGGSPSPTPGGSGEPADSFEEVATGLRDAEGNMIYKKTWTGNGWNVVLDSTMKPSIIKIHKAVGHVSKGDTLQYQIPFYETNSFKANVVAVESEGLKLNNGAEVNGAYYVTIYYTYVSVN